METYEKSAQKGAAKASQMQDRGLGAGVVALWENTHLPSKVGVSPKLNHTLRQHGFVQPPKLVTKVTSAFADAASKLRQQRGTVHTVIVQVTSDIVQVFVNCRSAHLAAVP